MNTGVYQILNSETGTWYRGAAKKQTFEVRWYKHKQNLNAGEHYNDKLQEDWNHYGQDAFVFSVLERCPPELCSEREEWWIGDNYNDRDVSYNKRSGGTNGFSESEETKQKKSEVAKRPETILKQRQARGQHFTVTWPDGRVKRYLSKPEAAAELGVGRSSIDNYLKGFCTPGGRKESAHLTGCVFEYV